MKCTDDLYQEIALAEHKTRADETQEGTVDACARSADASPYKYAMT